MQNAEDSKQESQPQPPPVRGSEPPPEFRSELRWFGPDDANRILTESHYQRKHSPGTVSKYARDMKASKWEFNGAPIRYNGEDQGHPELLDGQHRLRAVIEANMVMPFVVIMGIQKPVSKHWTTAEVAPWATSSISTAKKPRTFWPR